MRKQYLTLRHGICFQILSHSLLSNNPFDATDLKFQRRKIKEAKKQWKRRIGILGAITNRLSAARVSARLAAHPNDILLTLLEPPERKRLQRHLPNGLPTRFMV
jgi:hypothetical protein